MCDFICAPYLTIIVTFILCLPARSEMNNETKRQRSLVVELRSMISDLFDSADATEAEEEDKKQRGRKSVDEDSPAIYKNNQADKLRQEGIDDVSLRPLYPCDEFDEGRRSCTSIRQIGTTLTFGVHLEGGKDIRDKYFIRWFRFFKVFKSDSEMKEELTIEKKPWNMNLGEDNTELRLSPITETDYSHNYFVAFLAKKQGGQKPDKLANLHYLKFYIQPLAIDMGTLYHGEELFINVRSFIELPEDSVTFDWRQSDLDKTNSFPRNTRHVSSNMKKNVDGSTLIIKEFMDSTDKILSCDVYSNKNVFVAKRDFLLRKIAEPDDSQSDLEKEVAHERKRRSLPENYEYASYSDKDEVESVDAYAPEEDIKVVNVDTSATKRDPRKYPPGRINERSPIYNTHGLQYHRHYRIPSAPTHREHPPIARSYDKESPSALTYDEQPSENLVRYPANPQGKLNERSPVYNNYNSRNQRRYRIPNAPAHMAQSPSAFSYSEQISNVDTYGKLSPSAPVYGEQSPSAILNGEQLPNSANYGIQPPTAHAYVEQPPNAGVYGKQAPSVSAYSNQLSASAYGDQPSAAIYGDQSSASAYGKQPASILSNDKQPDQAMLKSPFLKTLIKQANSLAHPPPTQKSVEFRRVDIDSQGILTFDDLESRLISNCKLDSECGTHAFCYGGVNAQTAVFEPMFCRCKSDYVGNGIFCWIF